MSTNTNPKKPLGQSSSPSDVDAAIPEAPGVEPASAAPVESPAPAARNYVLRDGSVLYRDGLDVRNGGIYCVGNLRGSKPMHTERIDDKTGEKKVSNRLLVNVELLDGSGESVKLEFNGWDRDIPKFPFKHGDDLIFRIVDNYKGVWQFDAVARFKNGSSAL